MIDYLPLANVLIELLAVLIGLVFSAVILPFVRDTVIPWLREKRLLNLVGKFVQAAEKLGETGVIDKDTKKSYVLALLKSKGVVITPVVDAFVESAVLDLDKAFADGFEEIAEEFEEAGGEMLPSSDEQTQE